MLDVTLLYHEETHGALVYQTCKPLDTEDPVAPLKSAERYHRLVGVQNDGAGKIGLYSSDYVPSIALVGLQVFHQGIDLAAIATKSARRLTGTCLKTSGRCPSFGAFPHRRGGQDRRGKEEGEHAYAYRGQAQRIAADHQPRLQACEYDAEDSPQAQDSDCGRDPGAPARVEVGEDMRLRRGLPAREQGQNPPPP